MIKNFDCNEFNKRQTFILKGIACCLLLFHHLFMNNLNLWDTFIVSKDLVNKLALISKVCVAIFLIVSGYGLYISFGKSEKSLRQELAFIITHILKLMANFWLIYILFVLVGFIINPDLVIETYGGRLYNAIVDFFGLARLFGTNTINPTWWFMSLIILFYLIFPFLVKALKKSVLLFFSIAIFFDYSPFMYYMPLGIPTIQGWLLPFCFGIFLARYSIFERIVLESSVSKICSVILLIITGAYINYTFTTNFYLLFAMAITLFSFLYISRLEVISSVFEYIGKHSSNIFMFHTFIFSVYFKDYIYSLNKDIYIYIVLLITCLVISTVIEFIKRVCGYNKLIDYIKNKIHFFILNVYKKG